MWQTRRPPRTLHRLELAGTNITQNSRRIKRQGKNIDTKNVLPGIIKMTLVASPNNFPSNTWFNSMVQLKTFQLKLKEEDIWNVFLKIE